MSEMMFDPDALHQALVQRAEAARAMLEDKIAAKLSGEILQQKSGALAASICSSIGDEGSAISVIASSVGVPYAAIHEFGGKTAAHDIVAVKARALKFSSGGAEAFAKNAHHPGSNIPARSYLGQSLADLKDEMASDLRQAALESLRND